MYTGKKFLHALKVIRVLCGEILLFWDIYDATQFTTSLPDCMASHFRTSNVAFSAHSRLFEKCTFLNVWYLYLYSKIHCRVLITVLSAEAFLDDM